MASAAATVDSCSATHWLCLSGEAHLQATISTSVSADHASKAQQSDLKLAREAAARLWRKGRVDKQVVPAASAHPETDGDNVQQKENQKAKAKSGSVPQALCLVSSLNSNFLHLAPRYLTGSRLLRTTRQRDGNPVKT